MFFFCLFDCRRWGCWKPCLLTSSTPSYRRLSPKPSSSYGTQDTASETDPDCWPCSPTFSTPTSDTCTLFGKSGLKLDYTLEILKDRRSNYHCMGRKENIFPGNNFLLNRSRCSLLLLKCRSSCLRTKYRGASKALHCYERHFWLL